MRASGPFFSRNYKELKSKSYNIVHFKDNNQENLPLKEDRGMNDVTGMTSACDQKSSE